MVTPSITAPSAPPKPTVSANDQQVTLSWTTPDNGGAAITSWEVASKAGSNAYGSWTSISGSGASTTSHTVTGLTNGTAYQFKIRAVNSVGNGAESSESDVVTPSAGICGRTKQVRDGVIWEVSGKSTCEEITKLDLATITELSVGGDLLVELKDGDLDDLSGLKKLTLGRRSLKTLPVGVFDDLVSLKTLNLVLTNLGSPPAGLFDNLTSLTELYLGGNNLTSLPESIFDNLTNLRDLYLNKNDLTSLPDGVFDNLTSLKTLHLDKNNLTSLPEAIFDNLTSLTFLDLGKNNLTRLQVGVFDNLTKLEVLNLRNNSLTCLPSIPSSVGGGLIVDTHLYSQADCGPGVTVDKSILEVVPNKTATYTVVLDAAPTGDVTVTPTSSDEAKATVSDPLTFTENNWATSQTITITGVAAGSSSISHTISGGGYGNSTVPTVAVQVISMPSAPQKPTVVADNQQVGLFWATPNNGGATITSWEVARKAGSNAYGSWTSISGSGASTTSHTVTGLTNGTAYQFKVRAVNSVGAGAESPASDVATPSTTASAGICGRTQQVQDAIIAEVPGKSACGEITELDLAMVTELALGNDRLIRRLKDSDFDNLIGLKELHLNETYLRSLPEGIFDDLSSLTWLNLHDNYLIDLSEDIFDNLTNLTTLYLSDNSLSSLPSGIFDNLTNLEQLFLHDNYLSSLPSGVFDNLTSLTRLDLDGNRLSSLPGDVFDNLTSLTWLYLYFNDLKCVPSVPSSVTSLGLDKGVTPCGAGNRRSAVPHGEVVARQVATPSAPPKPTVSAGDQQVTLSWRAPDDDGGAVITSWHYATKQGDNAYSEWKEIPNSDASTTSYTVTGLSNGKTYRFKIRAVNSVGNGAESPESDAVTPSISKETIEEAMVSEALEQVMAHNVAAVTSRLGTISSGNLPRPAISLDTVVEDGAEFLWNHRRALHSGTMDWESAISGSSFSLPLSIEQLAQAAADGNSTGQSFATLSIWGSADYSSYGNEVDGIDLDGHLFSAHLGIDIKPRPHLVTGLALALNRSSADYDTDDSEGTYEVRITSVNPYVSWSPSEALSLWASGGYGQGETELKQKGEEGITEESPFSSFAGGGRFQLWRSAEDGAAEPQTSLALRLDGATAHFRDVNVQMARLAGEFSRTAFMEAGQLTSSLELGLRMRSDEAAGMEVGGRINWLHPVSGLSSEANARVLLAGGDQQEWGIGGRLRYKPSSDGAGLVMELEPSFGVTSSRLTDLWSLENGDLAVSNDAAAGRLKAELGYGFSTDAALITPYSDFFVAGGGSQRLGMGLRYSRWSSDLEMELRAEHQSSGSGQPERRIGLELSTQL